MKTTMDRLIHSLVMIRLGQELGSSSDLAQTVAGIAEMLIRAAGIFCP